MELSSSNLLNSLKSVQWFVAANTYGSSHTTLIGLLVNWWITPQPGTRWAVESGPAFGYRAKGIGGGMCDAIFCEARDAVGVLEVEGSRGKLTAKKIGKFFAAEYDSLQTLRFAILLLYAYSPEGCGLNRIMPPAQDPETFEEVARVSGEYPNKSIIVITLDKAYERQHEGIRARSEYYWSRLSSVRGFLYEEGKETASCVFYG